MIRVRTGSRLHFGLLAPFAATGPRFGGCGLMVEEPRLELSLVPAAKWECSGPLAPRAAELLALLRADPRWGDLPPYKLTIHHAPPAHGGLGSGTQLSLAVAQAFFLARESTCPPAPELAKLTGRGRRSGIGVAGFAQGGFLCDHGKLEPAQISQVARTEFPENWPLLVVLDPHATGTTGDAEAKVFAAPRHDRPALTKRLSRLLDECLLPALVAHDFETVARALSDYNRFAGEFFAGEQGGTYSTPRIAQQVTRLNQLGIVGVGQSSWGPTVFALCPSPTVAAALRAELVADPLFAENQLLLTTARNRGAEWTSSAPDH